MAAEVLVTWTGPVGWALAAFSWIAGLGSSKQKQRDKLFRKHAERNAARGWQRGDNQVLRAATGGGYDTRVSNAQRAIDAVNALLGEVPAAPWLRRKKFGKSGKLYTLRDVQENIVRRNNAVTKAQIEAQKKESARQAKVRRSQGGEVLSDDRWRGGRGGSRGPFGTFTRGQAGTTLQSELFSAAVGQWLGGKLDADAARQRLARSTNRRGALAQSPRLSFGRTGRTAAGDTGRLQPIATQPGTKSGNVATQPQHSNAGKVDSRAGTTESAASREAKRVLSGGQKLPQTVAQSRSQTGLAQMLGAGALSSVFGSASRFATSARFPTATLTSSSTPLEMGTRLTPLNAAGVQSASQSQQRCNCPSEKKKRKSDKPRCKNPVISRTTKDGIRTTKVKIQCQPSKPKLP